MKALEKMELIAPAHIASPFTFEFRTPDAAPNPMLVMEDVRCGYHADDGAEIPIVERVTLSIQNGQRIGLLGANGQGKSTLIKTLAGTLAPLSGHVREGKGLTIGYFAQHQLETLREDDSPLAHLARLAPDTREQELRDFLGGFNFRGDMATSAVGPFSGGEKARPGAALIIWQKPNLLLLDDRPTTSTSKRARADDGAGAVRRHADPRLARPPSAARDDRPVHARGRGTAPPFDGDLDDYRDWLLQHAAEQRAAAKADSAASATEPGVNRKDQKRQAAEERQRLSQLKKPLQNRISKLEKQMETLHAEKARLDAFVADPASYEAARKTELTDAIRTLGEVTTRLEAVEAEWLAVQEELEQIG
jgi:ATP-binding cassette subfamily F protein 3